LLRAHTTVAAIGGVMLLVIGFMPQLHWRLRGWPRSMTDAPGLEQVLAPRCAPTIPTEASGWLLSYG